MRTSLVFLLKKPNGTNGKNGHPDPYNLWGMALRAPNDRHNVGHVFFMKQNYCRFVFETEVSHPVPKTNNLWAHFSLSRCISVRSDQMTRDTRKSKKETKREKWPINSHSIDKLLTEREKRFDVKHREHFEIKSNCNNFQFYSRCVWMRALVTDQTCCMQFYYATEDMCNMHEYKLWTKHIFRFKMNNLPTFFVPFVRFQPTLCYCLH